MVEGIKRLAWGTFLFFACIARAQDFVDLEQGDYPIVVSENCIVDSGGFGPCIIQIIYDQKTKKAVVGHLDALDTFGDGTEAMITTALKELGHRGDLKVIVAGGGRSLEEEDSVVLTERARVLDTYKKHGFSEDQVTAKWLPPRTGGGLVFSTKSGKAELTISSEKSLRTLAKGRFEKFQSIPGLPDAKPETCREIIIQRFVRRPPK